MTRRRRLPVLRHLRPPACPDCGAEFIERHLQHEPSCPLSGAEEAIFDSDRRYFEEHPEEDQVTRPISRAELVSLAHVDPETLAMEPTHVHISRLPRGLRMRAFCNERHLSKLLVLDY